jgi:nucleoside-diphosphate-sugar epimerase
MSAVVSAVIAALISIESGGNPSALGDGGRAVGILQIHEVTVREANRILGRNQFSLGDRADPSASVAMARVVLGYHARRGCADAIDLACRWRNPYSPAPDWYRERAAAALRRKGGR